MQWTMQDRWTDPDGRRTIGAGDRVRRRGEHRSYLVLGLTREPRSGWCAVVRDEYGGGKRTFPVDVLTVVKKGAA